MLFIKEIPKKSMEMKILTKINKLDKEKLFLPIKKKEISGNNIKIYWKKIPYTIQKKKENEKWKKIYEKDVFEQISKSLFFLHSLGFIHLDVHFDNILCSSKHKYYLIDFSISEPVNNINNKLYLEWKEDHFQLLWNLVFHRNHYINDFSNLRKNIQKTSQKNKNLLKKELKLCLPKKFVDEKLSLLLSENKISIKKKIDQIQFKMFLQRLYLLYYIFIEKKDDFYQDLFHSINWIGPSEPDK